MATGQVPLTGLTTLHPLEHQPASLQFRTGLLDNLAQPRTRRSTIFFISPKGQEAFRKWLFVPGPPSNYRELLLRLFFAAPSDLPELRGHVEAFRKEQKANLDHYGATRTWLDTVRASNPQLAIWKLVLEYAVLQSESHLR